VNGPGIIQDRLSHFGFPIEMASMEISDPRQFAGYLCRPDRRIFCNPGHLGGHATGKPKIEKVIIEKEVYLETRPEFGINETELKKLNLSSREM